MTTFPVTNNNTSNVTIGLFIAEAISTLTLGCLGLVLNTLVCYATCKGQRFSSDVSMYLASVSVADLLCSMAIIVDSALNFLLISSKADLSIAAILCKTSNFFVGWSYLALSSSLICLSSERYRVFVKNKGKRTDKTTEHSLCWTVFNSAKWLIAMSWIYGAIFAIPLAYSFNIAKIQPNYSRCAMNVSAKDYPVWSGLNIAYYISALIFLFVIPFVGMLFAYYKIAVRLYKSTQSAVNTFQSEKIKKRQIIVLFSMTIAFMLSSLPFIIVLVTTAFLEFRNIRLDELSSTFWYLYVAAKLMYTTPCLYDPILYSFVRNKFREKLATTLTRTKNVPPKPNILNLISTTRIGYTDDCTEVKH